MKTTDGGHMTIDGIVKYLTDSLDRGIKKIESLEGDEEKLIIYTQTRVLELLAESVRVVTELHSRMTLYDKERVESNTFIENIHKLCDKRLSEPSY